MLEPYPLGHIHANRQINEGQDEGSDEEDDTKMGDGVSIELAM